MNDYGRLKDCDRRWNDCERSGVEKGENGDEWGMFCQGCNNELFVVFWEGQQFRLSTKQRRLIRDCKERTCIVEDVTLRLRIRRRLDISLNDVRMGAKPSKKAYYAT